MVPLVKNALKSARDVLYPTDRRKLLRRLPKNAICAEVGVWKGDFSSEILKVTQPKTFHLIDPWLFQQEFAERWYGGLIAKSQEDMDNIYEGVVSRFESSDAVVFNRGKSAEQLDKFTDDYFDWIYIDGNHYFEFVLDDLQRSFEKVKPGGIIAGDDYLWGPEYDLPVKQAVAKFISDRNLTDALTVIDTQFLIQL